MGGEQGRAEQGMEGTEEGQGVGQGRIWKGGQGRVGRGAAGRGERKNKTYMTLKIMKTISSRGDFTTPRHHLFLAPSV